MPDTDISSAVSSDLTNVMTDYSVDTQVTDGTSDQKETEWTNPLWTQYFGYFNTIPELNAAINAKATWTVGKGFLADEVTTMLLGTITGWGKDTFNTILENCIRTYHIGGDSFCEIIRSDGVLVNIKSLDPSSIKIIVDGKGRIKRYEQTVKTGEKKTLRKFQPEDIFHLARNRVADEIHGVSIIPPLVNIILMRNEAMADYKQVLHRFVKPRWIIQMDTDETGEVTDLKTKMDKANEDGENMYIPKGTVELEQMSIAPNSTLNPQTWIDNLNEYFYEAVGVPKIIIGSSRAFTEASAKIAYLAFQQTIEEEQLFIEEQVLLQLNLVIELEFPASLENELLSDKRKDGEGEEAAQPNETTAGEGE